MGGVGCRDGNGMEGKGMSAVDLKLVVFKQDGSRKDVPVKSGTYTMGRDEGAQIRIPLASVSRKHAELRVEDNRVVVRDLGSSNGTTKNFEAVKDEAELAANDVLGLGDFYLRVQIDGMPASPERPEPPAKDRAGDSTMVDDAITDVTKPMGSFDESDESSMMDGMEVTPQRSKDDLGDDSLGFDFDDLEDDDNPTL